MPSIISFSPNLKLSSLFLVEDGLLPFREKTNKRPTSLLTLTLLNYFLIQPRPFPLPPGPSVGLTKSPLGKVFLSLPTSSGWRARTHPWAPSCLACCLNPLGMLLARENRFLLFKPCSAWYFVTASLANEYTAAPPYAVPGHMPNISYRQPRLWLVALHGMPPVPSPLSDLVNSNLPFKIWLKCPFSCDSFTGHPLSRQNCSPYPPASAMTSRTHTFFSQTQQVELQ